MLQLTGLGLVSGSVATIGVQAGDTDLPNTLVVDGRESNETVEYEFLVSGTAGNHPDLEGSDPNDGHVTGVLEGERHGYQFSGTLSYLDVSDEAKVTIHYGDYEPAGEPEMTRLEIVANDESSVDYTFTSDARVEKVLDNQDRSADEEEDAVTESGGTWTVEGSTANGYGDTYDLEGEVTKFEPVTGGFTLFVDGEETTVTSLTGQEPPEDDGPQLVFETEGEQPVDYYLEIEDGVISHSDDGDTVSDDYSWMNDDGTKLAARVRPGETHAYEFEGDILDVSTDGDAAIQANGDALDLDAFPRDGAAGDYWKGYFPWQIEGEERTHTYSFEANGEEFVDYYLEVEEGGDLIPSTVDDAIIEYEYFWIGDDGTKAAGRIQPGDRHAYAFDTLVADVTIEGEADAFVNGVSSNLYLYPRDVASGDHWKSGFPWQDEDHEPPESEEDDNEEPQDDVVGIRDGRYDGPVGGGDGYPDTFSADDADIVVPGDMSFGQAASSASSGDVVFIENGASISHSGGNTTWSQDNLTIAASRGDSSVSTGEIHRRSSGSPFDIRGDGVRLTGLHIDGHGNGSTCVEVRGQDVLIDNCFIRNNSYSSINVRQNNSRLEVRQCAIVDNAYGGTGYGVQAYWSDSDYENRIQVLYNVFDNNRRDIAGSTSWIEAADNHIESRGVGTPGHAFEVRAVNQSVGAPAGNAHIHHNELTEDGTRLFVIRGVPTDEAVVERNWAYWSSEPVANGGSWGSSGVVLQPFSDQAPQFSGVEFEDNHWGQSDPN